MLKSIELGQPVAAVAAREWRGRRGSVRADVGGSEEDTAPREAARSCVCDGAAPAQVRASGRMSGRRTGPGPSAQERPRGVRAECVQARRCVVLGAVRGLVVSVFDRAERRWARGRHQSGRHAATPASLAR